MKKLLIVLLLATFVGSLLASDLDVSAAKERIYQLQAQSYLSAQDEIELKELQMFLEPAKIQTRTQRKSHDNVVSGQNRDGRTVYTATDVPIDIPEPGLYESTINIADVGAITDVNCTINIDHTWDADLDIFLVHGQVSVELTTDNGSSGDNFTDTIFDDEADTPILDQSADGAPFTGSFQPEGLLSDFDGIDLSGDWILQITDDAGGDIGVLNSWSLEILGGTPPEDPVLAVFPGFYNFGEIIPAECSEWETFTLTNIGPGAIDVSSIEITGMDAADFEIQNNPVPCQLPPDATIDVRFCPSTEGEKTANLTVTDGREVTDIPLIGMGYIPGLGENISSAIVIEALPFNATGSTVDYEHDYGSFGNPEDLVNLLCTDISYFGASTLGTAPDVVFELTLDAPTQLIIDLCDSDFDTAVALVTGDAMDSEDVLLIDDDSYLTGDEGGCPVCCQSYLACEVPVPAGTYYIIVGGYGTSTGNYDLTIEAVSGTCPAPIELLTENITVSSADLSWTPIGTETLWNLEFGAGGFVQGEGTMMTGLADPSYALTGLTEGIWDWYVQADCGTEQSAWAFASFMAFDALLNDECSGAVAISEVTDEPFDTTIATTSEVGTHGIVNDIWFVYTAGETGTIDVDLCDSSFDTKLAVWDDCDYTTELAYNDDDSSLCTSRALQSAVFEIPVLAGEDYFIQVGGYGTANGAGDITISFTSDNPVYGIVDGTVTDTDTGAFLMNAEVTINGMIETTDDGGYYMFDQVLIGTYPIFCTAPGYENAEDEAIVTEGETTTVDFALTAIAINYDPVVGLSVTTGPGADEATLNWMEPGTGGGDLEEGFDGGVLPDGWMAVDNDNDGYNWEVSSNWEGYDGSLHCMTSASYDNDAGALLPDNWLISPSVMVGGGYNLTFWVAAQDPSWVSETYYVKVSNTTADVAAFTDVIHTETLTIADYHLVTLDLSAYAGQMIYLAWNHADCTDWFYLNLDSIAVMSGRETVLSMDFDNMTTSSSRGLSYRSETPRDRIIMYDVYQDGVLLGDTDELTYLTTGLMTETYEFGVVAVYDDGGESDMVTVEHNHVEAGNDIVGATQLTGNFPNPFNPSTDIAYSMNELGYVKIEVFNVKGQKVKTLVDEAKAAGTYSVPWNGLDDNGNDVTSGIYFYKMDSGTYTNTQKMMLIK